MVAQIYTTYSTVKARPAIPVLMRKENIADRSIRMGTAFNRVNLVMRIRSILLLETTVGECADASFTEFSGMFIPPSC